MSKVRHLKPRAGQPPPAIAPEAAFLPQFDDEGLDLMIDVVVDRVVADIRAREAAIRANPAD